MVEAEPSKEAQKEADTFIEAEPGQVTSLRKLGGRGGEMEKKKRGWGSRGTSRLSSSDNIEISSNSLKDIVPDLKPLLSSDVTMEDDAEKEVKRPRKRSEEEEEDSQTEGPSLPREKKSDEVGPRKRRRVEAADETDVVLIINLTRPFTVNQLKEMLKRTGTIQDFWIDK